MNRSYSHEITVLYSARTNTRSWLYIVNTTFKIIFCFFYYYYVWHIQSVLGQSGIISLFPSGGKIFMPLTDPIKITTKYQKVFCISSHTEKSSYLSVMKNADLGVAICCVVNCNWSGQRYINRTELLRVFECLRLSSRITNGLHKRCSMR